MTYHVKIKRRLIGGLGQFLECKKANYLSQNLYIFFYANKVAIVTPNYI